MEWYALCFCCKIYQLVISLYSFIHLMTFEVSTRPLGWVGVSQWILVAFFGPNMVADGSWSWWTWCMFIYIYIMCVWIHVCICIYKCVYIYVYIYIYSLLWIYMVFESFERPFESGITKQTAGSWLPRMLNNCEIWILILLSNALGVCLDYPPGILTVGGPSMIACNMAF